jgi:two-component system, LytTR family, response regulator
MVDVHEAGSGDQREDDFRETGFSDASAEHAMKLLIVDGEPQTRAALSELCGRSDGLHVVGEAGSGSAAIKAVDELRPDVMLLDVELPDMSGFDVLRAARTKKRGPLGIIVTANPAHAVTAFAAGALDCLLKPVNAQRFAKSIQRARERCADASRDLQSEPHELRPSQIGVDVAATFLIGERARRLYPLSPQRIDYIESDANYVTFRVGNLEYLSRDSIKRLASVLDGHGFVRIERSLLLNVRAVMYVERLGHGAFAFTLASGRKLRSSPRYRERILRVLPLVSRSSCEAKQ